MYHSCRAISNPWQKLRVLPAIWKAPGGGCRRPGSIAGGNSTSREHRSRKGPGSALSWARFHLMQGFFLGKGACVCQLSLCGRYFTSSGRVSACPAPSPCALVPWAKAIAGVQPGAFPILLLLFLSTHMFGKPLPPCGETSPGWRRSDPEPSDRTRTGLGHSSQGRGEVTRFG